MRSVMQWMKQVDCRGYTRAADRKKGGRGQKMSRGVVILLALPLAGCVSSGWGKPSAGEAEWQQDSYACERDVRQSRTRDVTDRGEFFERCMKARGWNDDAGAAGFRWRVPR